MTLLQRHLSLLAERGTLAPREVEEATPGPIEREELTDWAQGLDLEATELLFVLGIGDGSPYHHLKEWLHGDPDRILAFIEPDLGALRSWLESEAAAPLLNDPQVKLFLSHTETKKRMVLNWCVTIFSPYASRFAPLPGHLRRYPTLARELADRLGAQSFHTAVTLQEVARNCSNAFYNFYSNLRHLPMALWGNRLYNRFDGVPAIICGAGSSLAKNGHLLAGLQDRALIFAPGSALQALISRGIRPHFGVGVDPNPDQLEKMESHSAFEVPLFYGHRWRRGILRMGHAPHLFVSGLGICPIDHWIEEELGIGADEEIRHGHTATHIAIEIARQMGCNPLILVGQDLAYTEGRLYDGALPLRTPRDIEQSGIFYERPIMREDLDGKSVETAWKWILERRWLTRYAKDLPEVQLINATEGGLEVEGLNHLPLAKVADRELRRRYPLEERLRCELGRSAMPEGVTMGRIDELIGQFQAALMDTERIAEAYLDELERMGHREELPASRRSGRAALLESDLCETLPYRLVFGQLLDYCTSYFERGVERIRRLSEQEGLREWLKIDQIKGQFVLDGARLHREILKKVWN